MERFQQLFNMPGMGQGGAPDAPVVDTAEKLHISSLALLKMLKHGESRPLLFCYSKIMYCFRLADLD